MTNDDEDDDDDDDDDGDDGSPPSPCMIRCGPDNVSARPLS